MHSFMIDMYDKIYAIVKTYDDVDYNQEKAWINIFFSEKEYNQARNHHYKSQEFTGETWKVIYKKP